MKKFILFIKNAIILLLPAVNASVRSFSQSVILHGKIDDNRNKPLKAVMVFVNSAVSRK